MLTDGVIALREIEADDIPVLHIWRNDVETRPMFLDDRPLEVEAHNRFVRQHLEGPKCDYWWMVEMSNEPLGTICLFHFSADRRVCEFGRFIISPQHRGKGYGRRALKLAMNFARALGVERICCVALSSNERALRLYDHLGFTVKRIDGDGPRSLIYMEAEFSGK